VEIGRARPNEYAEAGEVTALAYQQFSTADPDWQEYLVRLADVAARNNVAVVLVAVDDGRVLGSVTLELDGRISESRGPLAPGEAHVRMLAVRSDARRRGAGRALMERCIEEARLAGKSFITLNTTQRMEAAQAMYESLGFVREPDEVHPDGFVLLSYSLRLPGAVAEAEAPSPQAGTALLPHPIYVDCPPDCCP